MVLDRYARFADSADVLSCPLCHSALKLQEGEPRMSEEALLRYRKAGVRKPSRALQAVSPLQQRIL